MSQLSLYVIAVCISALGAIHVPINGALGARIGSPIVATLTFYGVALLSAAALAGLTSERTTFRALADVPAWYWILPSQLIQPRTRPAMRECPRARDPCSG